MNLDLFKEKTFYHASFFANEQVQSFSRHLRPLTCGVYIRGQKGRGV